MSADVPDLASDLIPLALTGGEVAFNTGNTYGIPLPSPDISHSRGRSAGNMPAIRAVGILCGA
ncbi:MAG: hypothetical protein NT167_12405 [Verrucomicrobia bacterium]|nr:hypothetical protein [Verrucomicrobiota bacterium]